MTRASHRRRSAPPNGVVWARAWRLALLGWLWLGAAHGLTSLRLPALYAQPESPLAAPATLWISEFHALPHAVKDVDGEWIELANWGDREVDLYRWRLLADVNQEEVILTHLVIPPGGYVVLARRPDPAANGGVQAALIYQQIELGNQAGALRLVDPAGSVVDEVRWGEPPIGSLAEGASLERVAPDPAAAWAVAHSPWPGSAGDRGSPGQPYTPPPPPTPTATPPPAIPPRLLLSEFMADPAAVGDDTGEWIEVYNADSQPIALGGWVVADADGERATIETGFRLEPGRYAVVAVQPDPSQNGGVQAAGSYHGLRLANEQDEVILITPWGVEVDRVVWGPGGDTIQSGTSLERTSWTGSSWVAAAAPWPGSWGDLGSPNAAYVPPPSTATPEPSPTPLPTAPTASPTASPPPTRLPMLWSGRDAPAPLVIDQVLPGGSDQEYIVLANVGEVALPLAGWMIGDAEVPGDREGLLYLPADVVLDPGARWVLARYSPTFQSLWGVAPQAEWSALTQVKGWASGEMALADTGDEVILLDPEGRLADVAAWNQAESGALGVVGGLDLPGGHALWRAPDAPYPWVSDLRHRFILLPPAPTTTWAMPAPQPHTPMGLEGGMVALWGSLGAASTFSPGGSAPPHVLAAAAAAQGLDFLAIADLTRGPTDFLAWRWQPPTGSAATVVYSSVFAVPASWEEFYTFLALHDALAQWPTAPEAGSGPLDAYTPVIAADSTYAPGGLTDLQRLWQAATTPILPGGNTTPPLPGNSGVETRYTGLAALGNDPGSIMAALRARRGWLTSTPGLWLTLRAEDGTWMGATLPPAAATTLHIAYGDLTGEAAGLTLWQGDQVIRQLDVPPTDGRWTVEILAAPGQMIYAVATQLDGDFAVTAPIYVMPAAGGEVVINEVLPAPGADHNGDGKTDTGDEYIELYNPGGAAVWLGGYTLGDANSLAGSHRFTFEPDQVIEPGARRLVWKAATGLSLNDDGDLVQLAAPDGSVVDQVVWGKRRAGPSLSRVPDGGEWQDTTPPTPGEPNRSLPPKPDSDPKPANPNPDPPPVDPTDVGDPASPNFGQASGPPGSLAMAKLRGLDAQVEFRGQVVVPPGFFPSAIYVAEAALDAAGAAMPVAGLGVMVYLRQGDFLPMQEGDWVLVRGVIKSFRGEMEIQVDEPGQVWPIAPAAPLQPLAVTPGEITEALEGRFVTFEGVITGWQGDSLYLGDPDDPTVPPVRVTVRSSLAWKRPYVQVGESFRVVGVVSQFARESPWNGGYRVLVRYPADLVRLSP